MTGTFDFRRRALLAGALALAAYPAFAEDRRALNARVFDFVWKRVERGYYDANFRGVDWQATKTAFGPRAEAAADESELYLVLNEMLDLLDPHTSVTSPTRFRQIETRRREGVGTDSGFDVRLVEERYVVTAVRAGSPAERAGVQVGWLLDSYNGEPIRPGVITGPVVDAVFLDQADAPVALRIEKAPYASTPYRISRPVEGAQYLRFDHFHDPDIDWAEQEIIKSRSAPLIVDLRQNGGGLVTQFERLVGAFFERRVSYGEFRTRNGRRLPLSFPGRGLHSGPLVVLADTGSSSASEIFAAVVQDQARGRIVGEQTRGAVLGSEDGRLPDGGYMSLTVRDFVLSSGRRIESVGVTPDIAAPRALKDWRSGEDPGLAAAIGALAAL